MKYRIVWNFICQSMVLPPTAPLFFFCIPANFRRSQAQILDPQTPRLPGPSCVFGGSLEKDYDLMLEHRMLSGQWILVDHGCRTLQWMLSYETSQTFILALLVRVCLCTRGFTRFVFYVS